VYERGAFRTVSFLFFVYTLVMTKHVEWKNRPGLLGMLQSQLIPAGEF